MQICAHCGSILRQVGQVVFCDICNYQEHQGNAVLEYNENLQVRTQMKQKKYIQSKHTKHQQLQAVSYDDMVKHIEARMKHVFDILKNMNLMKNQQYQQCIALSSDFITFMQQFNEQTYEHQFVYIFRVYGLNLLSLYKDGQGITNERLGSIIAYYILTIVGIFIPPRIVFNYKQGLFDQDAKRIQVLFQSQQFKDIIMQQTSYYKDFNSVLELHIHYLRMLCSESLGVSQLRLLNEDMLIQYLTKYYGCLNQIVFYHNLDSLDVSFETYFILYAVVSNLICMLCLIIQFEGVNFQQPFVVDEILKVIQLTSQNSQDVMEIGKDGKQEMWFKLKQKKYIDEYYTGLNEWLTELDENEGYETEQPQCFEYVKLNYCFAKFPEQVEDYGLFEKITSVLNIQYKYLLTVCCRDVILRINAQFSVGNMQ